MTGDPTDFEAHLLSSIVEGYLAREGMKDRIRALNEWEIARRSGTSEDSYAQYEMAPGRDRVRTALAELERQGLISVWERGIKYDSFVPTAEGTLRVHPVEMPRERVQPVAEQRAREAPGGDPVIERLDEVIRLLRSIESKLGRP
jgi:hypothetical protein